MRSSAEALDSYPTQHPERAGTYLALVGSHANLITAAMFLTGMAANPMVAKTAKEVFGVTFSKAIRIRSRRYRVAPPSLSRLPASRD